MSEYKNVRAVFDDICKHVKIDKALIIKLEKYKLGFITKNDIHFKALSTNLIGCYPIRMTDNDFDKLYDDILQIDKRDIVKPLNELIPTKYYQVAGDNWSLSLVWLAHAIRRSNLPDKDKTNGQMICFEMLQYKYFTSRLWRHWSHSCSEAEAEAILAALSNKFEIKQKGNWLHYFRDSALGIIGPNSIHKEALDKMDRDMAKNNSSAKGTVAYVLTDNQTRIRNMIKIIFDIALDVHEKGKKITSDSKIGVFDGEKGLKDDFNAVNKLKHYIHSVIPDKNSFQKPELIDIIIKVLPTMPTSFFLRSLDWLSENYASNKNRIDVSQFVDKVIEHAIVYLSKNNEFVRNKTDISYLLTRMKGIYSSSRATDEDLIEVRKLTEQIVSIAARSNSPAVVAATRNGVLLYILLRAFTMSYYSN